MYTAPSGRPSSYHGPWPWSVINLLKSPLVGRRILAVEGKSAMSNQHGAFAMTRAIAAIAIAVMLVGAWPRLSTPDHSYHSHRVGMSSMDVIAFLKRLHGR